MIRFGELLNAQFSTKYARMETPYLVCFLFSHLSVQHTGIYTDTRKVRCPTTYNYVKALVLCTFFVNYILLESVM